MRRLFWCSRLRASAGALQLARRCLELGHRAAQSARRMEIHLADIERAFGLLHRVAVASLLILEPQRFGCARQRDDLAFLLLCRGILKRLGAVQRGAPREHQRRDAERSNHLSFHTTSVDPRGL